MALHRVEHRQAQPDDSDKASSEEDEEDRRWQGVRGRVSKLAVSSLPYPFKEVPNENRRARHDPEHERHWATNDVPARSLLSVFSLHTDRLREQSEEIWIVTEHDQDRFIYKRSDSLTHRLVRIGPMSPNSEHKKVAHPVRGSLVAVVLGPPMVVSGAIALVALIDTFLAGWIPTRWFSQNGADWLVSYGLEGGASNYITFMVCAMVSYFCYAGIVWGYSGTAPGALGR